MRKLTRILVRRFWGACAFLLISLAVFVAVGRELSPKLERYKNNLAGYLSSQLAVDVQIQAMEVDWSGLSPELRLDGVKLSNAQGQTLMSMATAQLKLNLLRSVINKNLALDKIVAANVDLELTQNENGVWGFPGVPTTANDDINIDDPLDIFLLIGDVELSQVQFDLKFRSGEQNTLNFRQLTVENSGRFHRLSSTVEVENQREAVSLVIEFHGDPRNLNDFSAEGYADFHEIDVSKVIAAMPGNWQAEEPLWKGSVMTAETWFDIFAGGEVLFRGRVDVAESNDPGNSINLGANSNTTIKIPQAIEANFTGRLTAKNFWSVSVRDAVIDWADFQAPVLDFVLSSENQPTTNLASTQNSGSILFRSSQLDISAWLKTLSNAGLIQAEAQQVLDLLNPRGQLNNVDLSLPISMKIEADNSKPNFELRANFADFSIDSWRGTPIATNMSGYTSFFGSSDDSQRGRGVGGTVEIDSNDGASLRFPTLYKHAMNFDSVLGQVDWQVNLRDSKVTVHSGLIAGESSEGSVRGFFDLLIPFKKDPKHQQLIIQLGVRDCEIKYYQNYIPSVLPADLLNWLEDSVGTSGTLLEGGFIYRGGMTKESRQHAAMQMVLDVDNASLDYHPKWPPIQNAKGQFWMNELAMYADVDQAIFMNGEARDLAINIDRNADGSEVILDIDGDFYGDASDALDLLRTDVFQPVINNKLDDWVMAGPILAEINLLVPIKSEQAKLKQNITVKMTDVDLLMKNIDAEFSNIVGTIRYDDEFQLQANKLQGSFLEGGIEVDLSKNQQLNGTEIVIRGRNTVDHLRRWTGLDALQFVSGDLFFNADLILPYQTGNSSPMLTIRSDLLGTNIDLPQPWGKSPDVEGLVTVQVPLGDRNTYYRVNYSDRLFGVFHRNQNGLQRAVLSTEKEPVLPEQNQFIVRGKMPQLDFDAWQKSYQQYFSNNYQSSSSVNLPLGFDLQLDQFTFGDVSVENLSVKSEVVNQIAKLQLDSTKIAGDIVVYGDKTTPIDVKLQHLRLPKNEPKSLTWADVFFPPSKPGDTLEKMDPSSIPAFDFVADEVFLGESALGAWSFQLRPTSQGLVLNDLQVNFDRGRIMGQQQGEGAALFWGNGEKGPETWIRARLVSNDLASVIEQWDQPQLLQSESANIDFTLRWPGAPTSVSTSDLTGEVQILMEQGSFYRAGGQSSGSAMLQLVSILNFDTWVRRLRLDFSDLGRRGMSFNKVEGLLDFEDGSVYLNQPMIVETQSGKFQLTGVVDLNNDQLDTKLTATLPMGGNLTFLTALAAGLPAAAGVWVVSKIFDEQIDKVSTLTYTIDGSIEEPNIVFDRLFENKTATNAEP